MIVKGVDEQGNWHAYAGDSNSVRWQFFADGRPVDISGCELRAQARVKDTDALAAIEATCTIVDPVAGTVDIAWDGEEVRTMLKGRSTWKGVWDLQVLPDGAALPDTVHRAEFFAQMDVTKAEATP